VASTDSPISGSSSAFTKP
jgi:tRNA (adenine37-N6)-methyltransferase